MLIVRFYDGTWVEAGEAEIYELIPELVEGKDEDEVLEMIERHNEWDKLVESGAAKFLGNAASI